METNTTQAYGLISPLINFKKKFNLFKKNKLRVAIGLLGMLCWNIQLNAQCALDIDITTAYNFIVDSNIESPPGNNPTAAYISAEICNTGTVAASDVFLMLGDGTTAGTFSTGFSPDGYPFVGEFSLTMAGSTSDATRFLNVLDPGECIVQYWMVEYPSLDDAGDALWGATNNPNDDYHLPYEIWATSSDCGTASATQDAILRNEITASANKIWPNGDNKVPDEYVAAMQAEGIALGWDNDGNIPSAGECTQLEGVWYDMGVVNQGFDNDGDFAPDYNVWMQPVGDPAQFNPDCFQLANTYGLLIVKSKCCGEILIPFENQLYFTNLPANSGVVGLVFYEFKALDGACVGSLTPYQEAASGSDNEKFNADYGTTIPIESAATEMDFNKNVDFGNLAALPGTLTYTLDFTNNGDADVGAPDAGMPLVVQDAIPAGTEYIAGSAEALVNSCTCGGTYTVLYSTDNGVTWTAAEPGDPTTVTNLQWWLSEPVSPTEAGQVQFQITVPSGYPGAIVENIGGLSIGNHSTFIEDNALTFLPGTNSIGDQVWIDDGTGGGTSSNGVMDGGEVGLDGIDVTLYYDINGNGVLDPDDYLWGTQTTSGGGMYDFTDLPDGTFFVVPDNTGLAAAGCNGCGATTDTEYTVTLSGGGQDFNDADFGYMQPLSITKTLVSSDPGYEGQPVIFEIDVTNNLVDNECVIDNGSAVTSSGGASSESSVTTANTTNALGAPDGTTATLGFDGNDVDPTTAGNMWMTIEVPYTVPPNCGEITSAVGKWFFNITNTVVDGTVPYTDDQLILFAIVDDGNGTLEYATDPTVQIVLGPDELSNFVSPNIGLYSLPLPQLILDGMNQGNKVWLDITTGVDATIGTTQVGATDDMAEIHFDAVGLQLFCDGTTVCDPAKVLNPVALEDVYDSNILEYVSSSYPITSVTTDGGMETITWDNVGPILPGETHTITVTFDGLEPTDLLNGDLTTNTATVTSASLGNGLPANTGTDNATVTIENTGTICGTIWSDSDGDGWQGATGQEAGEDGIPGVEMTLTGCTQPFANNGSCGGTTITETVITDADGNYCFDGLIEGYEYIVAPTTSTLPGSTFTQTGDPDDDPTNGSGNGGTCGNGGANSPCDNVWDGEGTEFQIGTSTWNGDSWDVTGINFGYVVPPTIYGNVFEDIDDSGSPTTADYPLGGITVYLCSGLNTDPCNSGNATATATTDPEGNYIFEDLATGDYTISTGFGTGTSYEGTNGVPEGLDGIISVTVNSGDISGSHDFGINQTGTSIIGDTIFYDVSGDGIQSSNEEGIPNVDVNLYVDVDGDGVYSAGDYLWGTQTTTTDGWYEFNNLPPYDYVVVVDGSTLPSIPLTQTADPDGAGICLVCDGQSYVMADGSSSYLDEDFGYQPIGTASIGDQVYIDNNGDGIQAATDPGIPNITVDLYVDLNGDGTYVLYSSTETDANGNYLFENLPDASYYVEVNTADPDFPVVNDIPYANSNDTNGDPNQSIVVISGGVATSVEGTACGACTNLDADFGYAPLINIGDQVYWDANGNGTQDWNEDGIPGVTVELCPEGSTDLGAGPGTCMSLVTDATGYYQFTNVLPPPSGESYTIVIDETQPALGGSSQTGDPNSDGLACDDPLLVTYGYPACDNVDSINVPLNYGTNYSAGDFGYQPYGVIGDYVWYDANGDGIQDDGETGIAGVPVYLCSSSNPCTAASGDLVAQTTTDFDGYYTFSLIPDGSYVITADPGATYQPTSDGSFNPNAGNESIGATSTTLTMFSGEITDVGGMPCTDCDLNVDFGYELAPTGTNEVAGTICIDTNADGTCDADNNLESVEVSIYQILPPPTCNYTLVMQDSWGDGWNGGSATVTIDGTPTTYTFDGTQGSPAGDEWIVPLSVATGSSISLSITNGSAATENYYELQNSTGSVIHSDGSVPCVGCSQNDNLNAPATGVVFTGTADCGPVETVLVSTTSTDPSGNYTFTGLGDGNYIVAVNTNQSTLINATNGTTTTDGNSGGITGGGTPDFTDGSGGDTWGITLAGGNASNVDFAFTAPEYDFGDLPSSYNVLVDAAGPYHENPSSGQFILGTNWDAEPDGQVSGDALNDDLTGNDEDGVDLTNLSSATNANVFLPGDNVCIDVTVSGPIGETAYVYGWLDFDLDGTFSGDLLVNEAITLSTSPQTTNICITIPADAIVDTDPVATYDLFARFRVFAGEQLVPELSYSGFAYNGEVEDYLVSYNPLPVELAYFDAKDNGCTAVLEWQTLSEENNKHFIIEHSNNGRDYTSIGMVEGAGNSASANTYTFTHRNIEKLFNYYRIKQVDFDGSYEITEPKLVRLEDCKELLNDGRVFLYPNPTQGVTNIEFHSYHNETIKLELVDMAGRLIYSNEIELQTGVVNERLDLSSYDSGVFILYVTHENEERKAYRIVKMNE